MNVILRLVYQGLRNEVHVEYNRTLDDVLAQHDMQALNIAPQYQSYKSALNLEASLLDAIRKSEHTAEIYEQDHVRDDVFRGLAELLKGFLHHFNHAKHLAAEKLHTVFENYGNITRKTLDAETAAINDLLEELNGTYAPDVALLGLGEWTRQLDAENRKFRELMALRYAESAAKPTEHMRNARYETDRTLRALLGRVEAIVTVDGTAQYELLIRELNAVTERYKHLMARPHGKTGELRTKS